jgi:hypothetical protein
MGKEIPMHVDVDYGMMQLQVYERYCVISTPSTAFYHRGKELELSLKPTLQQIMKGVNMGYS